MTTCSKCGGDVIRFYVGDYLKYRHAVPGADHAPMPAAPRSQLHAKAPTSAFGAASPASVNKGLGLRADAG